MLRLSDPPLTLFENAGGEASQSLGHLIVGGARSSYYVKLGGDCACSVGVQLQPGGALALLGVPAGELAERHTPLDALWGLDSARLREQLQDVRQRDHRGERQPLSDVGMRAQLDHLESVLLSRVRRAHADEQQRQWLAHVIPALDMGVPLATVVESSRVSHRTFITRFRNLVGLSPKTYERIRRFQRVVETLSQNDPKACRTQSRSSLAQLALDAGYADQAHLSRDFTEFAGISPITYSRLAPAAPNHVAVRQ